MKNKIRKRILYVMPDNPMGTRAGNLTRTNSLLKYFDRNFEEFDVDFVSYLYWDEESKLNFKQKFPKINLQIVLTKMPKKNLFKYVFKSKIPKFFNRFKKKSKIDEVTPYLKFQFDCLQKERQYDIALISYSSAGKIIKGWLETYCILDTHDFLTLQRLSKSKESNFFGEAFQEEINIMNLFDEIWTYSLEEHYIFDQFTNSNVKLVPVSSPVNSNDLAAPIKYSVLYVASDNQHNVNSIQWFINRVLPLLGNVKIYIVGKICSKIQDEANIVKLGLVNDLDAIYKQSKITICPMLSGTGVKIKVLESLSYGLPVVATRRGVDGLVNKSQNGCLIANEEKEFARYILKLLSDQTFYTQHQIEARSYFEKHHHPELETQFLDKTFMEV